MIVFLPPASPFRVLWPVSVMLLSKTPSLLNVGTLGESQDTKPVSLFHVPRPPSFACIQHSNAWILLGMFLIEGALKISALGNFPLGLT